MRFLMGALHPHNNQRHHNRLTVATVFTLLFLASASPHQLFEETESVMNRRRLVGPGSSPPTCRSKCGKCTPCKPVHVPIQPGLFIPLEYYPEAWRCKCRNKFYMP